MEATVIVVQPSGWQGDAAANFDAVGGCVQTARSSPTLIVLPELIGAEASHTQYEQLVTDFARAHGAWVVGGSHHDTRGRVTLNRGVVATPEGEIVVEYQKRYPYGTERSAGVSSGPLGSAVFEFHDRRVRVAICADLFHPGGASADRAHLVAVPAFSVTTRSPAILARATWKHIAFARAYESGAYVAVADWKQGTPYESSTAAGAGGLADPSATSQGGMFRYVGARSARSFTIDFERIDRLHAIRHQRGFLAGDDNRTAS